MILDTEDKLNKLIFAETDQSVVEANNFINLLLEVALSPSSISIEEGL
ncbi:hypothetical protein [Sporosarcina sp. P26b]|nr:hypothetical protein [Sporosarcina sp. P26b]